MAVVGLVVPNPLMGLKLGDVLTDLSPERYVNQLVAFAYAQNWLSGIQKSVQDFDLAAIPFRFKKLWTMAVISLLLFLQSREIQSVSRKRIRSLQSCSKENILRRPITWLIERNDIIKV